MAGFDYGAAILGGAQIASNIATNQINAERAVSDMATYLNLVKKQRDWQKEDYQWSEDYTKRMMDYQFQNFSSPSAQMAAYKQAGLNPWILGQNGSVGSGQGTSPASAPTPSRIGVSPFERPPLSDPFQGGISSILQGSAVQNQRLVAMAEVLKSAPDAFKALGKKGFDSVMRSVLGQVVDSSLIENISESQALNAQHEEKLNDIKVKVAEATSMEYANNLVSLQQMEFAKYSGEFNLMQSEVESNRAKVRVAASEYVRNIADALHLKKVGDYYEANAMTINAIRDLTVQSLQYRVNSQRRNDVTEQAMFDAQRGLREHIREEGKDWNSRFIQNWDIETDPFYNEVSRILSSWHISTNVGITGSYGSKDVYGHGFGY